MLRANASLRPYFDLLLLAVHSAPMARVTLAEWLIIALLDFNTGNCPKGYPDTLQRIFAHRD